jgi:copper homeostasis protein
VRTPYLLEISVETLDAALAAERGGAQRIELCSNLAQGGLTPELAMMRSVREQIRLPIFSMIRPRDGDFVYSAAEFAAMVRDIEVAMEARMDGLVLGLLRKDGGIDVPRMRELVERAKPLPVTFHRAFDVAADLSTALEDVIAAGAARILTSGGGDTASDGIEKLAELVRTSRERVIIIPGSGITASNVMQIARRTQATEFHAGLTGVRRTADGHRNGFEAEVRKLAERLRSSWTYPGNGKTSP